MAKSSFRCVRERPNGLFNMVFDSQFLEIDFRAATADRNGDSRNTIVCLNPPGVYFKRVYRGEWFPVVFSRNVESIVRKVPTGSVIYCHPKKGSWCETSELWYANRRALGYLLRTLGKCLECRFRSPEWSRAVNTRSDTYGIKVNSRDEFNVFLSQVK